MILVTTDYIAYLKAYSLFTFIKVLLNLLLWSCNFPY